MFESALQTLKMSAFTIKYYLWSNVTPLTDEQTAHQPYIRQQAATRLASQIATISAIIACLNPDSPFATFDNLWDQANEAMQDNQEHINEPLAEFISWSATVLGAGLAGAYVGNTLGNLLYGLWSALQTKGIAWQAEDRPLHQETIIYILGDIKKRFLDDIDCLESERKASEESVVSINGSNSSTQSNSPANSQQVSNCSPNKTSYFSRKVRELDDIIDIREFRSKMLQKWQQLQKQNQITDTDNHVLIDSHESDLLPQQKERLRVLTQGEHPILYQFINSLTDAQQYHNLETGILALQRFIITKKRDCRKKYSYDHWEKYQDCLQQYGDIASPLKAVNNHALKVNDLSKHFSKVLDKLGKLNQELEPDRFQEVSNRYAFDKKDNFQLIVQHDILRKMAQKPRSNKNFAQFYDPLTKDRNYFKDLLEQAQPLEPFNASHNDDFRQHLQQMVHRAYERIDNCTLKRLQQDLQLLEPLKPLKQELSSVIDWLQDQHSDKEAEQTNADELGRKTGQLLVKRYNQNSQQLSSCRDAFLTNFNSVIDESLENTNSEDQFNTRRLSEASPNGF